MSTKKTGKEFEELVYNIYKELEPLADVKWNDHIMGARSKTSRQIDISIRNKIAGHEILIIIQAKDLTRTADVNIVGQFEAVIRDVGAQKGILICNTGFTKGAKEEAMTSKIDLCSAHDASNKKWQTEIQVPVLKKSITVNLTVNHSYVKMGPATIKGIQMPHPEDALNLFLEKWQSNELPKGIGKHTFLLDKDTFKIDNKDLWPIVSKIDYEIKHRHHFKFFTPTDYRGIRDFITQNFTPSFIEFKEKIPFTNDGTWKFVPDPSKITLNTLHLDIEIVEFDMLKRKLVRMELVQ